ncbi:MAG: sodium:alanine symporter family protein [Candidatus Brocadiae bacterium]|nr:sodium:alanine symporter family protein [Candidatus Brocadiia bacterium]
MYSDQIATWIWTYMVYLLFAVGLWLTWKTGFIQFLKLGEAAKALLHGALKKKQSEKLEGDVSSFAALATALAATVGNGNIAGVATALYWGGPGAIFWMWICGFLGMATKYAEATLGIYYREKHPDGTIAGGPMYYIKNGIKNKKIALYLAGTFAACGAFSSLFGTGNMMQGNQITSVLNDQLGFAALMQKMLSSYSLAPESIALISKFVLGFIITVLVGLVVLGGLKRISQVAEKVVPTMIVVYLGFGLYILITHITALPSVFELIFTCAFTPCAAVGGFIGASVSKGIQFGFRRGLLSNEAGLGSAPIAHAAAQTPSPVHQGLIGIMEVFIDTIIVCTMTGLINLATGEWQGGVNGIGMTVASFSKNIPHLFGFDIGGIVVAISSFLFGYTTIIGWGYYGEQCAKYLFGLKVTYIYRVCYVLLTFVGCVVSIELAFFVGDIANAIMALPNLIALILLSGTVGIITREFFQKYPKLEDFKS